MSTRKFERAVFRARKKLDVLKDSKTEIENRLRLENEKLSNIKDKIRSLRKDIENPFDFTELIKAEEIDIPPFFDLAEEGKIVYNQTPINEVLYTIWKCLKSFFTNGYFFRR